MKLKRITSISAALLIASSVCSNIVFDRICQSDYAITASAFFPKQYTYTYKNVECIP